MSLQPETSMSRIRANWMGALEIYLNSRPETISRKEILDFMDHVKNNSVSGPLGLPLKAPSWLTNDPNDKYASSTRGSYILPWTDYDTFVKSNTDMSDPANSESVSNTDRE